MSDFKCKCNLLFLSSCILRHHATAYHATAHHNMSPWLLSRETGRQGDRETGRSQSAKRKSGPSKSQSPRPVLCTQHHLHGWAITFLLSPPSNKRKEHNKSDHHPPLPRLVVCTLTLHCVAPNSPTPRYFFHLCTALHRTWNHFTSTSRFCLFGGCIPVPPCLALPCPFLYRPVPIGRFHLTLHLPHICTYLHKPVVHCHLASSSFESLFRLPFRADCFASQ